jgi:hypothetical protein
MQTDLRLYDLGIRHQRQPRDNLLWGLPLADLEPLIGPGAVGPPRGAQPNRLRLRKTTSSWSEGSRTLCLDR